MPINWRRVVRSISIGSFILAALILTACGDDPTGPEVPPAEVLLVQQNLITAFVEEGAEFTFWVNMIFRNHLELNAEHFELRPEVSGIVNVRSTNWISLKDYIEETGEKVTRVSETFSIQGLRQGTTTIKIRHERAPAVYTIVIITVTPGPKG